MNGIVCAHLLKEVRSRDLVKFALVDDLHSDLLAGENMPGEFHDGEMTAAKRLLQVVQAGDLAIVVAVAHSPMHLVSLKQGNDRKLSIESRHGETYSVSACSRRCNADGITTLWVRGSREVVPRTDELTRWIVDFYTFLYICREFKGTKISQKLLLEFLT